MTLFSGSPMLDRTRATIRKEVQAAYRHLKVPGRKVSGLQLRRHVSPALEEVPLLVSPVAIKVTRSKAKGVLIARLAVAIEGDPAPLQAALPAPAPAWFPEATLARGALVFEARFTPLNAPFVAPLLYAELDLARALLARQAGVIAALRRDLPRLVKLVVAEQLPKLVVRRKRR